MRDSFAVIKAGSPEQAAALLKGVGDERIAVVCCATEDGGWQAGDVTGPLLSALKRVGPVILAFEGGGVVAAEIAGAGDYVIAARETGFAGKHETLSAEDALREGSINRVADAKVVRKEAEEIAESISRLAPNAVVAAKHAVREGMRLGLEEGLDIESRLFESLFGTADMKEGTSAFLEKRRAEFKGF